LTGAIEKDVRKLISQKAGELGCEILALEIMPDHVHLFLNCPPTLSPSDAMFWLKGYSSKILREKYPSLRRMPSMWTRSFFVSTAGNVSSETIQKYIAQQKSR
jgi:putative transposase